MQNFEWYQCNIVEKDGRENFWCRFVAKNKHDAHERIRRILNESLTGIFMGVLYKFLENRYIKDYKIAKVPERILRKYNFMKAGETDLFYERVKG